MNRPAAAGQQGEAHSDFIQPLTAPPIDSLPFDQLLRFWQHPVRAFFQQRLRVNFRAEEDDIPDDEPFTLEGLSRYQLNQQLLNTLIEEQDVSAMFRRFRAAGELPYGAFGELVWETQRLEMQALAERVMAERQQAQSMEIDLQCGGVNLTGWLQQVQPDGLAALAAFAAERLPVACNFGLEHLVTAPAAAPARAGCLCGRGRVALSGAGARRGAGVP